jgi:hypothetical protein
MPTFFANSTPIGTYPIKLKVTDSSGLSSDLTTAITIRDYIFNGTSGNDSWRVSMNPSNIVDFYENAAAGALPTFSIPFDRIRGLIRFVGGDGDDTVSMDYPFPCNVNLGTGNDTLVVAGGAWWAEDALPGLENIVVSGSASFDLRRVSYRFTSLTLIGSGKLTVTGTAAYLHLGTLSISDNATLDLNDKGLIVDSGDVMAINNLIVTGRLKSTPLSLFGRPFVAIVNANPVHTTFSGETNLVGGEILVRRAKIGDLNFDDQITIADFIDLSAHFNQSPATWQDGDTNGDGAVTIADFITLASNFQASAAPAAPQGPLSATVTSIATAGSRKRPKLRHHAASNRRSSHASLLAKGWAEKQ